MKRASPFHVFALALSLSNLSLLGVLLRIFLDPLVDILHMLEDEKFQVDLRRAGPLLFIAVG